MSNPLRRVLTDAASLLMADVLNRASTFIVYALVARALGAHEFGQLSLALTLFYTFQVLAVAGLTALVTREISRAPGNTSLYVVHATLVALVASVLSFLALVSFLRLMGYPADTTGLVAILCLALLPYSISAVFESAFQAWQRMYLVACTHLVTTVAKVSLVWLVLAHDGGVVEVGGLLVVIHVAVMLIEAVLLLRMIGIPRTTLSASFAMRLGRATVTFLGIEGVLAVAASLNILILSKLASPSDVGLFSAAMQLLVPAGLVFRALAMSVYAVMCRDFHVAPERFAWVTHTLLELLLILAVPMFVVVLVLAEALLQLAYGREEFAGAATVMRIMALTVIPLAVTNALGQVLYASGRERVTLRVTVVDAMVALVGGFGLIGLFGLVGAAAATAVTRTVDLVQHCAAVASIVPLRTIGRLAGRPVIAGGVIAAYLVAVAGQDPLLAFGSASVLYLLVLACLMVWTLGGFQQLGARYLHQWSSHDGYRHQPVER